MILLQILGFIVVCAALLIGLAIWTGLRNMADAPDEPSPFTAKEEPKK